MTMMDAAGTITIMTITTIIMDMAIRTSRSMNTMGIAAVLSLWMRARNPRQRQT